MKRRLPIVLALAVALAFAASGGPRHARAAAQGHDHAASAHSHTHHESGSGHSHAAESGDFAEGGNHEHAGGAPQADQGCCYAWCTSVAVIHAAAWVLTAAAHDAPLTAEKPFRIAALSAAIDPPPR